MFKCWCLVGLGLIGALSPIYPALGQGIDTPEELSPSRLDQPIPEDSLPDQPLPQLPPLDELLPSIIAPPLDNNLEDSEEAFYVGDIVVVGSTVFEPADWLDLITPYLERPVTFSELLSLRTAITERYVEQGYVTSGALIPPQTLENDTVTIQVIEGELVEIMVLGTQRLSPDYIRSRIGLAAAAPLNVDQLLAGLQRLQIDPLIQTISADLQAGVRPGTSILVIEATEADSFSGSVTLANNRSTNIGGAQRSLDLTEGNVFGLGDQLSLGYNNTDGSNGIDFSYVLPISPNNDTLRLAAGYSNSRVINSVFSVLDISSDSFYYELGIRHPLVETPTNDLALGLTLSHQESQTRLGLDNIGPFPLSPGADQNGSTRLTALRFFQEWTQRSQSHVLALRSQVNLGLDLLNATNNPTGPDSQFLSWRGQGQWVKLLGKDSLFFLRGDVQLAADDLLSQEEFGLGGQSSVRGYRQDALLRDNGALLSAELRLPIARIPELEGVLQITPFLDIGTVWNTNNNTSGTNTLAGTGFGLLWQQGEDFSARLDWGLPLVDLPGTNQGWQDSGIYFSIQYQPF